MNKRRQTLSMAGLVMALFLLPATVNADPILLTLDTTQTVTQGSSVTYNGSLTNGGSPGRFINATSITLNVVVG